MNEKDFSADLSRAIGYFIKDATEKKPQDKEAEIEKTDAFKDDPIGKAKEGVGLALWEGSRKIAPFIVPLIWIIASIVLIIVVFSFLVVWVFYIKHLLADKEGIRSFLRGVYTFLGGVASTSLLFFLNRKPRQ